MRHLVAQAFWLSVPVVVTGILHMFVVKARLWPGLAVPLDGGRTVGGVPIFGDNKTWRGVAVMVGGAALFGVVQGLLGGAWAHRTGLEAVDYARLAVRLGLPAGTAGLALGHALVNGVMGAGYVLGELPNSFLKRRVGVTPGKTSGGTFGAVFFLVDQADSVIGALGLALLFFPYPLALFAVGLVCLTLLHLVLNGALYLTRVRRNL